jgi:hypothetical protein
VIDPDPGTRHAWPRRAWRRLQLLGWSGCLCLLAGSGATTSAGLATSAALSSTAGLGAGLIACACAGPNPASGTGFEPTGVQPSGDPHGQAGATSMSSSASTSPSTADGAEPDAVDQRAGPRGAMPALAEPAPPSAQREPVAVEPGVVEPGRTGAAAPPAARSAEGAPRRLEPSVASSEPDPSATRAGSAWPEPEPGTLQPATIQPAAMPSLLRVQRSAGRDWFVVDRPGDALDLLVLPGEVLDYDVEIDVGVGEIDAGDVQLSAGRSELVSSLPDAKAPESDVERIEVAWVRSTAKGAHFGYELRHMLETRFLPGPWPRLVHKDEQRGSENRNRELRLGFVEDKHQQEYRSDGHCRGCKSPEHQVEGLLPWQDPSHCKKCKRLEHRSWNKPQRQDAPSDGLDMLGAVWVARTMVKAGVERSVFPIVDRKRLWRVEASIGAPSVVSVPAGRYRCRPVALATSLLRGEPDDKPNAHFEGLFGLQGTLRIWLEEKTGTPVLIEGDLPIPVPLVDSLRVRVQLKSAKGADPEFRKLP